MINDGDSDSEVATRVGTDGIQSYGEFDMLATDIDVAIERASVLPEYVMQEKDDILKASSFRFVSFVHSILLSYLRVLPTQGGTVTRVLSWLFNNNYYVAPLCSPGNGLGSVLGFY